jgi:hypothetical protein
MDTQSIVNALLGIGCAVLGWFGREMWSAIKTLRDDVAHLREEIATDRVHKEDFKEAMRELKEMLNRIIEKLERKADK